MNHTNTALMLSILSNTLFSGLHFYIIVLRLVYVLKL